MYLTIVEQMIFLLFMFVDIIKQHKTINKVTIIVIPAIIIIIQVIVKHINLMYRLILVGSLSQ